MTMTMAYDIEQKCFQNKMKELDLKEKSSKSLLANVLDMDDDFVPSSSLPTHPPTHQKNGGFIRWANPNIALVYFCVNLRNMIIDWKMILHQIYSFSSLFASNLWLIGSDTLLWPNIVPGQWPALVLSSDHLFATI